MLERSFVIASKWFEQTGNEARPATRPAFGDDLGGILAGLNIRPEFRTTTIKSKTNIFRACVIGRADDPSTTETFPVGNKRLVPNRLIIRVQPDEGIRLSLMTKVPGSGGMRLRPAPLDLSFAEGIPCTIPRSYERLLLDFVRGDATLFMRRDEIEAAWSWVEPILDAWANSNERPVSTLPEAGVRLQPSR